MKQIRIVFALCKNFISLLINRGEIKFASIDTSSLVALDGVSVTITWSVENALFVRITGISTLFPPSGSTRIIVKSSPKGIYLLAYGLFTQRRIKLPLISGDIKLNGVERKVKFSHSPAILPSKLHVPIRLGQSQINMPHFLPIHRTFSLNKTFFVVSTSFNIPERCSPKMQSPDSFRHFKNEYQTRSLDPNIPPAKINPHEN